MRVAAFSRITRRLALDVSLAFVRLLGLFVARRDRADWIEEWQGELEARHSPYSIAPVPDEQIAAAASVPVPPRALRFGRPFEPLRDATGAIPDAFWHAKQEWRFEMLTHDLRFGVRTLLARPGFTATVVLTLALGVGANAVIFSAVDAIVLNPFSFDEPDRVIGVGTIYPQLNMDLGYFERISAPEFADIRNEVTSFDRIAGFDMGNRQIIGGDMPQNLFTGFWWDDALPVLGATPFLGRGFSREDIETGERVALISHRVWRSRFAADESAVGKTILIDDEPFTLIGIMPPEVLIFGTDLWMPMWADPELLPRNRRQFNIIARLAEGATLEQANAELETLARRTEAEYGPEFEEYADFKLIAATWTDVNVQTLKPAAVILMGAVGFVLLLVCANIASLLLSRSAGRQREIALRAALGAGRVRIVRQLLTESGILALLGGAVGLALAWGGLQLLVSQIPANLLPTTAEVALNSRVLWYTLGISLLAGVVFGAAPALQTSRSKLQQTLSLESGQSTGSRSRRRLHGVFVATEVALALVLLVGAGLLINSFMRLQSVDPGVDTDDVLTMRLTLPWSKYEGQAIPEFFQQLSERVDTIPGVRSTATGTQHPPQVFGRTQFAPEGAELADEGSLPVAYATMVDDDYFSTLGIATLAGRTLEARDRDGAQLVAVVNDALAQAYFSDESPVGKRFTIGPPGSDGRVLEIVGVVANTRNLGLGSDPAPEFFYSVRQAAGTNNQLFLIVRTDVEPSSVLEAIRAEVAAIDPGQPIYAIRTLDEAFAGQFAPQRFALAMLTAFAALALTLAAVGIYGVVSYAVADRTREIGVRMALGAGRTEVRRLMVRQALLPVAIGLGIGLGLAIVVGMGMTSVLYEVSGTDPLTLGVVGFLLGGVAALASFLPARRASVVDPVVALREG